MVLDGTYSNVWFTFRVFFKKKICAHPQDMKDYPLIPRLPSYGRGRKLPGPRHSSLINSEGLEDIVITGNNLLIDCALQAFVIKSCTAENEMFNGDNSRWN